MMNGNSIGSALPPLNDDSLNQNLDNDPSKPIALCASCDRCRARKTKCDGNRPCGNCAAKYMKKHKLTSIVGIDFDSFECVYSPAKRRGPVPGKSGRKADDMDSVRMISSAINVNVATNGLTPGSAGANANNIGESTGGLKNSNLMRMDLGSMGGFNANNMNVLQQMGMNGNFNMGVNAMNSMNLSNGMNAMNFNNSNNSQLSSVNGSDINDPLTMQRQLLMQQQLMLQNMGSMADQSKSAGLGNMNNPMALNMMQQQLQLQQQQQILNNMMQQSQGKQQGGGNGSANNNIAETSDSHNPVQKMMRADTSNASTDQTMHDATSQSTSATFINSHIRKHISLLEKSSIDGNRLRSYYTLSVDILFKLPPVPTDEEYCTKLNITMNPMVLPPFDLAALRAARFAELALGAMVGNQVTLSLELSNAVVTCLKQCAQEPVHPHCMFEVVRAYFLHGLFRSYRGDMPRYFKYRRVCLSKLVQLDQSTQGIEALLAAISFHDSWAYMIYNANEESLPDIDESIPPVSQSGYETAVELITGAEQKYQTSTDPSKVASDAKNQMWIQGPPPVFINNEAPPLARSLDALACAIRSCCDMAQNCGGGDNGGGNSNDCSSIPMTATGKSVMANTAELCSRNLVLSAFTLLQQSEATAAVEKNYGHHLLISAMDAFLEGGDEDEAGGFTDSQIQSLLSVSNTVINRPLLLYQGGPTYHMVTNTAIQLCHLLNGLYASKMNNHSSGQSPSEMEAALFDEVLDTYIALRKCLEIHRRKLPLLLRCHKLPRPNIMMEENEAGAPLIDLAQTHLCASRGCQGFVLMACSPCVAAERAAAAALKHKEEMALYGKDGNIKGEGNDTEEGEKDHAVDQLRNELNIEDDELISILGKIVSC